jgi:hypothetical protein
MVFFQQESATAHTTVHNTVWCQNNKQVCVASTFVASEPLQFFTLDLLKNGLNSMYNPFTEVILPVI